MSQSHMNGPYDLDSARRTVDRLRETFDAGRTRPIEWRKDQLAGLGRMLVAESELLIEALRSDLGRPRVEAFAADIGHARSEIRHLRHNLARWTRPSRVRVPAIAAPGRAWIHPEPLGVVLVIAPWNYPIQLLIEPMAAALAAGNCVVAKPSEIAPATSAALGSLIPRYVDHDAVAVVEGSVDETTALLAARWDHIFFTGSTSVGRVVAQAAAAHLTPTTLELGGKSPCYVHASADLKVTARRIAWGKFLNAGQTCVAPDYVLVDRSLRDSLVDAIRLEVEAFYGPDPQASMSLGRVVNANHLRRLQRLLEPETSSIVLGGGSDESARYLAPTIVVEPDPDGPLMREEIFGPILPVLSVDGPAEAAQFISTRPKPLASYVFSKDRRVEDQLIRGTSAGGTCVNQTLMHLLPPALPFGGVGDSGWGAYHGKTGFDRFSHMRSVLRKPFRPDIKLLYPPYGKVAERFARAVLR